MAIETYLIEESEKMIAEPEHLEEWLKTVEELGLEGQKKLTKEEKSPIPFPKMRRVEYRVYETLCPNKEDVLKYSNNTIPLRVLSLIALAQREQYFVIIEIWDDHASPDPVAVGFADSSGLYGENRNAFIIARWGDELRSFPELLKIAKEKWTIKNTTELKSRISDAQKKLETIQNQADKYFIGEFVFI